MKLTELKDPNYHGGLTQKTRNRYAQIHVLFRILAETKLDMKLSETKDLEEQRKIYQLADQSKAYWKSFFKVDSLKDLTDNELQDLERTLRKRIEFLSKLKSRNSVN